MRGEICPVPLFYLLLMIKKLNHHRRWKVSLGFTLLQPGFYLPKDIAALRPLIHTQSHDTGVQPIKQEPLTCRKYDVQTATANSLYYRAVLPPPSSPQGRKLALPYFIDMYIYTLADVDRARRCFYKPLNAASPRHSYYAFYF